MKKISRYVCTLALSTATVLAITTPPASATPSTRAITSANTIWVTDLTQATGSADIPSKSLHVWEW